MQQHHWSVSKALKGFTETPSPFHTFATLLMWTMVALCPCNCSMFIQWNGRKRLAVLSERVHVWNEWRSFVAFWVFFRIYLNEFIPALHCVPPPCCRAVPCSTSRGVRCGSSTVLKENNIVKQNKMFFCLSELRLTCCWVRKTKKKEERKEKINPTVCIVQKSGIENTPAFCSFQFEIWSENCFVICLCWSQYSRMKFHSEIQHVQKQNTEIKYIMLEINHWLRAWTILCSWLDTVARRQAWKSRAAVSRSWDAS